MPRSLNTTHMSDCSVISSVLDDLIEYQRAVNAFAGEIADAKKLTNGFDGDNLSKINVALENIYQGVNNENARLKQISEYLSGKLEILRRVNL